MNSTIAENAFGALKIALMKVRGIKCSLNGKQFFAEIIDDNMVSNGEEKSNTSTYDTEIDEDLRIWYYKA